MNFKKEAMLDHLYEGAYIVDTSRKIVYWNEGCERITGFTAKEVVDSYCYTNILQHVDQEGNKLCMNGCPLTKTIDQGEVVERDVFLHHKKGHRVPVSVKSMPLYNESSEIVGAIEVFTDTRFRESNYEENMRLKQMVHLDNLTGLYNRRYIDFQLYQAVNEYIEFDAQFGVLFVDIDHFKHINDTYGHSFGDEVLKTISNTIKANVRPFDFVGRWGGEEFLIILKRIDMKTLKVISERIRILCENSATQYDGETVSVTISIGGSLYRNKEVINDLIKRADNLMYESKSTGRNKATLSE